MSFQDVGKRSSNRQPVNAAMGPSSSSSMGMPSASSASAAASNVFGSMSISASTATSQISDSLTQYHVRNPNRVATLWDDPFTTVRFLRGLCGIEWNCSEGIEIRSRCENRIFSRKKPLKIDKI